MALRSPVRAGGSDIPLVRPGHPCCAVGNSLLLKTQGAGRRSRLGRRTAHPSVPAADRSSAVQMASRPNCGSPRNEKSPPHRSAAAGQTHARAIPKGPADGKRNDCELSGKRRRVTQRATRVVVRRADERTAQASRTAVTGRCRRAGTMRRPRSTAVRLPRTAHRPSGETAWPAARTGRAGAESLPDRPRCHRSATKSFAVPRPKRDRRRPTLSGRVGWRSASFPCHIDRTSNRLSDDTPATSLRHRAHQT